MLSINFVYYTILFTFSLYKYSSNIHHHFVDDFDYISVLEEILEKVKLRQTELGDREGSMTHHSVSLPIHLTIQTTQWKHRYDLDLYYHSVETQVRP